MDYYFYCLDFCYDTDSDDEENNFGKDYDDTFYYSDDNIHEYSDDGC